MQFAHSSSEPEKQPPPHPALPYDATAGVPHSAESAPSHGVAPRSLQAPHLHHPPHSAVPTPFHTIAPVPLHDAEHASSHHTAPVPFRNTAPVPLHGAVRVPTHGAVPAPHHAAKSHAAHSTAPGPLAPLGTAPELPEVWKQKSCKSARIFVFVRRIAATGADSVISQSPNGSRSRDELIATTRRTPMNDART